VLEEAGETSARIILKVLKCGMGVVEKLIFFNEYINASISSFIRLPL